MSYCNWNRSDNSNCCFEVLDKKSGIKIEINENCISYYLFLVNHERLVEVMSEYQRQQCISFKESTMIISSLIPQMSAKNMLNDKSYHEMFQFLLDFEGSKDNVQINDLFLFILTLCKGKIYDKLESLFHCLGGRLKSVDDYIINSSKLEYLLNFYLCLFLNHSDNYEIPLERIKEISNEYCSKAMNNILLFNQNNMNNYNSNFKKMKKSNISLRMFEKWFEIYGDRIVPWLRYIDLDEINYDYKANTTINSEITPNISEISNTSPESNHSYDRYNNRYNNNNNNSRYNEEDDDESEDDENDQIDEENNNNNSEGINSDSSEPDELTFDFPLSGNNNHLYITNNNIDFVIGLVEECKLYYFSCNDLYELLLKYTYKNNEHFLLRSKYYKFLKDIIPPKYHEFFIDLYNTFDITSTNSINIKQIYLCLSILVNGSKSEKLFYNFNLISSKNIQQTKANNNNGEVIVEIPYFTVTDMIYCLRSYLTLLMCINKRHNRHEISNIIYNTCIEVSYQLFNDYNYEYDNNNNIIVFEDFARWYNESGYLLTPWIELLDIKKWKIVTTSSSSSNNESIVYDRDNYYNNNNKNRKKKKSVKLNPVLISLSQNYNILFSEEVVDLYYHIKDTFYENRNENETSEDLLLEILKLNNNEVYVDYETYLEILEMFIGKENDSENDNENDDNNDNENSHLKFYFTQIYKMFYKNLDNNIIEIITMFLFFLDGTKSDKLNLMFLYFDQTRNYELNMNQMYSFLTSLLLTIINLTPDKEITLFQIHDLIADIINTHFINNDSEYISLEKFASWYNDNGYEIMSWIELISPNKWPERNINSPYNNCHHYSVYNNNELSNNSNSNSNTPYTDKYGNNYNGKNIIYEFELYPNERLLIIDVNSNNKLNTLNSTLKFDRFTVMTFFKEIKRYLPSNLNEEVDTDVIFTKMSKKLFKNDKEGYKSFKLYFRYIYSILQESMSYSEFMTSLSIFMNNNKTTKLCECWLYFIDSDNIPSPLSTSSNNSSSQPPDPSSFITRENFRKYLRIFLLSLFYICDITENSNQLDIIDKHIDFVYDNMIEYYTYNDKQSEYSIEDFINFFDFANYYNAKGSKFISWLELLDLNKWPIEPSQSLLEQQQKQRQRQQYNDYVNQIDNDNEEEDDEDEEDDNDDYENEEDENENEEEDDESNDDDNIYGNINENNNNNNNNRKNYQINSFNLELCDKHYLSVTNDNTIRFLEFLKETGFDSLTCSEISELLSKEILNNNNNNNRDKLNREEYSEILKQLITHINNHNIDNIFNTIFTIFEFLPSCDNNSDNIRYINDILIVYNFFGIGSKSEKLEYAFNLYSIENSNNNNEEGYENKNVEKEGIITFDSLRSLFYDYLVSISLFNRIYQYKNDKYNDIYEIEKIKKIVSENVNKVMISINEYLNNNNENRNNNNNINNIAFDEFASWYSDSGYYLAPWIELLDIRKWPNTNTESSSQTTTPNNVINNAFTFANGNNILTFLPIDIVHHKYLVDNMKLSKISSDEMINKIHEIIEYEDDIEIPKESYDEIIRKLVIKDDENENEKNVMMEIFNKIYSFLPNHHIRTIIGILSCYCNDKKSEKLFNIVNIFNKNPSEEDTMLNRKDVCNLLSNIYYSICVCKNLNKNNEYNEIDNNNNNNSLYNNSNKLMNEIVDIIFSDLNINNNGDDNNNKISFDIFAEWYSKGGYSSIPWIELLDLKKWPKVIEDSNNEENDDDDDNSNNTYIINLIEDNKNIAISKASSKKIKEILELTHLNMMSVMELYNNMKEIMNKELNEENEKEEDFENSILSILPNNNVYSNDEKIRIKAELKEIYNNMKYILSKEEKEEEVKENDNLEYLLCSLLLYLKGDKSEKLSMIYNILEGKYNENDEKGLNVKDLKMLLFSILRRIIEMNDDKEEEEKERENKDEICEKESENVIKRLFDYFKRDNNNDKIKFVEFAEWYSKKGERILKWIELLDLNKWP